ncbi:phosphoribosyltransferase [Micromonospora aurantiaca]|uniref:phosphoribosyltransferase n=1 Tax=Micromonospora aurantiaca (nom. illeg.) TaxID=47850 RepID=UPI001F0B748C|nr:phosphoribosyltransferase family protein [Micromonospora aurantiaca]
MAGDRTPTMLGWDGITDTADRIASEVRADKVPDVLVGVLRGGVIPAVLLAHALGVRTVRAVEVLHTTADGIDAVKSAAPQVANAASLGDLTGADVLVVDDVAGSGDTAARTVELVRTAGAARVRTAIFVVNVGNWRRPHDPGQALTYIGTVIDGWVVFPWERP